ncbi:LLM class flavin-dependent oxidoreductase [Kitasatospora sp. NPDC058218]|uniref:LLM class flavin-dependent oxidoreductase n=1 Tax=Kitasatospora sp. NPDC058218 TaxID=3346385 RepID=UPI0036DD7EAB
MEIGVGLPTMAGELTANVLRDWARGAERHGFCTLAVLDRLVCDGAEPLMSLAAAAAVTERIRLATQVLIPAYRGNTALLAKQVMTLQQLSEGRLVLGVAAGIRPDDFEASGMEFRGRGRQLDRILEELNGIWDDGAVGPRPKHGRPQLLVGGRSEAALVRMARYGAGTVVVALPEQFAQRAVEARQTWTEQGREGRPRLVAQAYYALGPEGPEAARHHLGAYYAFAGPVAQLIAASALTTPEAVREAVAGYRQAGCDELVLIPCSTELRQLDLLAAVVKENA